MMGGAKMRMWDVYMLNGVVWSSTLVMRLNE